MCCVCLEWPPALPALRWRRPRGLTAVESKRTRREAAARFSTMQTTPRPHPPNRINPRLPSPFRTTRWHINKHAAHTNKARSCTPAAREGRVGELMHSSPQPEDCEHSENKYPVLIIKFSSGAKTYRRAECISWWKIHTLNLEADLFNIMRRPYYILAGPDSLEYQVRRSAVGPKQVVGRREGEVTANRSTRVVITHLKGTPKSSRVNRHWAPGPRILLLIQIISFENKDIFRCACSASEWKCI